MGGKEGKEKVTRSLGDAMKAVLCGSGRGGKGMDRVGREGKEGRNGI